MIERIIDGINYHLNEDNKSAEVAYLEDEEGYAGDINIPETVKFNEVPYRVTTVGKRAFSCCYSLTAISLPDSVVSIGVRAFADCRKLSAITIPHSVKSIEERAFLWCFSLMYVTIPDSVTSIEKRAFS